ncbi:MAG: ABC transporter substrate-binding protein [Actinobacteria bacterium]|nr:ABC transporter substrate-binding protein [Actinomycetota bacterium]
MRPKAIGIVLLLALTGTACAGDVVRYHNSPVAADGVTILAGDAAAASGAGEVAAAVPIGSSDAAVTDTTAASAETTPVTEQGLPATPADTAASVTSVSGPAARYSRQATSGSPRAAATSGSTAGGAGGAAGPAGSAGSAGAGPGANNGGAGGSAGPSVPGAPAAPSGGTRTGVTDGAINVGVFFPRTGPYAGLFRNVPVVAQAALDEAGAIHGRKLVLKTYDDGTANAGTIQTEAKRAKEESFALMSVVSESNAVLAPLADKYGVPTVVGNIDEKVALPLTQVFPVLPFWSRQARILPGFIQNVLGGSGKRIGIVYEGTSTAIDAKNVFKVKAKEVGLNVVFEQPIAQNQSACANEVANLQSQRVEVVFMMNGPLGAICMLRDAKALGYKPTWTGVGISWEANVVATASGGGAEGIRKLTAFATLDTGAGRHFSEVMRRAAPDSGAADDDIMLLMYGMLQPLLEGLRRAGPDLTREGYVHTFETSMNGYDSGYMPPPTFGPRDRSGPRAVGVVACCTNGRWATPQTGWRESF